MFQDKAIALVGIYASMLISPMYFAPNFKNYANGKK